MSKTDWDEPERLRAADATQLERRLLKAASGERPSAELVARMARGIGVAAPLAPAPADGAQKLPASPAASSSQLLPWLGAATVAIVAAGVFLGTRPSDPAPRNVVPPRAQATAHAPLPVIASAAPPLAEPPPSPAAPVVSEAPTPPPSSLRRAGAAEPSDLARQVALVDAARSALAGGQASRALVLVRQYRATYPSGALRPEVAAVEVEAHVKLGRSAEARTLARQFAVTYGAGPLADRVARLAGLTSD